MEIILKINYYTFCKFELFEQNNSIRFVTTQVLLTMLCLFICFPIREVRVSLFHF